MGTGEGMAVAPVRIQRHLGTILLDAGIQAVIQGYTGHRTQAHLHNALLVLVHYGLQQTGGRWGKAENVGGTLNKLGLRRDAAERELQHQEDQQVSGFHCIGESYLIVMQN